MKNKLNNLNIKITELAGYLKISRPTLYKYIEDYEKGDFDQIDKKIYSIFQYIDNNELIQKEGVILFILNKYHNNDDLKIGDYKASFLVNRLSKKKYLNPLLKFIFSKDNDDFMLESFVNFLKSKKSDDLEKVISFMKGYVRND